MKGLEQQVIHEWLQVCYPAQVRQVMLDFSHCTIGDQAKIGIKGARGLKPGIANQRREADMKVLQTELAQRHEAMRTIVNRAEQDTQALLDEFL